MKSVIFWDVRYEFNNVSEERIASTFKRCLPGLLFHPEDGSNTFFQNIIKLMPDYKASHHRKQFSS
jgi:hypothetical protein